MRVYSRHGCEQFRCDMTFDNKSIQSQYGLGSTTHFMFNSWACSGVLLCSVTVLFGKSQKYTKAVFEGKQQPNKEYRLA